MKITCSNGKVSLTFGYFFPCWLDDISGIYGASAELAVSEHALSHGGVVTGVHSPARNIVITARIQNNAAQMRRKLEQLFSPDSRGTLTYTEGQDYSISYYAESYEMSGQGRVRTISISLICPDPLFYGPETVHNLGGKRGLVRFPLTHKQTFMVSERYVGDTITIHNTSQTDMGLIIRLIVDDGRVGPYCCPSVSNVVHGESLSLLNWHDYVEYGLPARFFEISTFAGQKRVESIGVGKRHNALTLLAPGSSWLQAHPGENVFVLDYDKGDAPSDHPVRMEIISKQAYWGV